MNSNYTIGVDFGTDSVRTILVDTLTGDVLSEGCSYYKLWKEGKYCNPKANQFRQHPSDHIEALKTSFKALFSTIPNSIKSNIGALSVASTGSTPVPINEFGVPLALTERFKENPNAMFILWKDHTAINEANEINELAHSKKYLDYTTYVGGEYSSEWFWAKILHIFRNDQNVKNATFSWVEHCDWIPALLTGNTNPLKFKRSRCAAGHKAMWHPKWNGLPSEEFLSELDPLLSGIRDRMYTDTYTSDKSAGIISKEWAITLGLREGVLVGVGTLDAHMGAIGGEIKPNYLVKVIGTSTCDMLVIPKEEIKDNVISGICGQVDGSIIPNMIGLEAGQSAFGDIYAWFNRFLMWPLDNFIKNIDASENKSKELISKEIKEHMLFELSVAAKELPIIEADIVAIDWLNGRRTPNSNQGLKGGVIGLTLSTDAPKLYKALVEATCFGSKKIIDRFLEEGVTISGIIAVGGVAQKSDFVMQTLADILDYPISVVKSEQTCALGAAMSAAVVAGIYGTILEAQKAMGAGFEKVYKPIPQNSEVYKKLYVKYSQFGEFMDNKMN
ncbi:ribulokinase [Maribacter hydrothermalis]|uniref:Ribulokinase n=1 Tax=Maribacter hydrothermalis TaxID=1836467 RepID=A0A1B7ZD10_9FLAO|nr:ribulokinase [Maribacter hydrothermalis]APQ18772.1 ribulokinase [Maribacter hydrothermalis]OBR41016.1 ribulokinase [Maribacter hydrothermalis]